MPDDITALLPLAVETPESILARLQIDLNAGIDPADPAYADMLPGSVWDDMARADALEMDRIYDRMYTEVPDAALPGSAIGDMLDGWADAVGLERKDAVAASGTVRFTAVDGTDIPSGVQVSTEAPSPDADPITFQVPTGGAGVTAGGFYDAPVVAVDEGSAGNVPANAVTILDTPLEAVSVTNTDAITGGADVETDEALQARVLRKLRGINGAGNVDYYESLALNEPGVGFVTVQANTPSAGHVTIQLSDTNRDPAPPALVAEFQAKVDPSSAPGMGEGLAAPGATVIVTTPTGSNVTVAATLTLEDGYSITGTAGTQAVEDAIAAAVLRYFRTLGVGDDVIHNKVLAAIVDVEGVADVTALTLNGAGGNVAIDATHVATLVVPLTLS